MTLLYPREMLRQVIEQRRLELPTAEQDTLFALVDTVFFASLTMEEGEPVRIAIVHDEGGASALANVVDSTPEQWGEDGSPPAWDVTPIVALPFEPRGLAKLSRGLRYGTHLAVVRGTAPDLWIDGIARRTVHTDGGWVTRIAAPRPGVVVFEARDEELLRFEAGERGASTIDVLSDGCPIRAAVGAITGQVGGRAGYSSPEWVLMRLLRHMRATEAGAILAMLPCAPGTELLARIPYRRSNAQVLANKIREDRDKSMAWLGTIMANMNKTLSPDEVKNASAKSAERDASRDALEAAIEDIAQMSAVDGSVVAGPQFAVYGSGYMIPSVPGITPVKALDAHMSSTEPLRVPYGARHTAAFSFAYANGCGSFRTHQLPHFTRRSAGLAGQSGPGTRLSA